MKLKKKLRYKKPKKLFGTENAKTKKGEKYQYKTLILYLSPSDISGVNICPFASPGCIESCLNTAGLASVYKTIPKARLNKTKYWLMDPKGFIEQLKKEITLEIKNSKKKNYKFCVRLNGTSDISWESVSDIIQTFPDVQFYDYTKNPFRFKKALPQNYHLTFSLAENNFGTAMKILLMGFHVAAVFRKDLPDFFKGYPVVNADDSDLRFLDPKGCIAGLKAKGKAKKDKSGFVLDPEIELKKVS